MKKILKPAVVAFGLMAMSATASAFSTDPCKNCHAIDHVVIGPAWDSVAEAYGNPQRFSSLALRWAIENLPPILPSKARQASCH
jgi:cytochrome c551/c552